MKIGVEDVGVVFAFDERKNNMIIGFNDSNIGIEAKIVEPTVNREASNYIKDNYLNLLGIIRGCEISTDKANDLLHDVFISIVEAEDNGDGFDMEFGTKVDDEGNADLNIMNVEQFVIGRIKLYAKNLKYRSDIIEATTGYVNETTTYYVNDIDEYGQEIIGKDGKPKKTKRTEVNKVSVVVTTCAASFNDGGDITENNDDLQKAYATASVADCTDEINEYESLRENIDYCIDVCSLHNMNLLNIFKSIDVLAGMLGDQSKRKKTSESVFKQLSDIVSYNDEFARTLMDVLTFASRNRTEFDRVIAEYQ